MYDGTRAIRNFAPERCSAPKAANGMAKHRLVRATILSMPRAWAISFFAADRPITSSARPAADIEKAMHENSRNTARIVGCMELANRYSLNSTTKLGSKSALALQPARQFWGAPA